LDLHSDKKGRNSLVWDAIEPLRPAIDAKVVAFIEAREFARRDFPQSGYNVHRLSHHGVTEKWIDPDELTIRGRSKPNRSGLVAII
jgi:CRISPR/Cas system-associated endonuclease Cas1